MHAVLPHNMNYVYDSIDSSIGLETAMHTHFIWSAWDVDLSPLKDQAKSFAPVMQVGQEPERHINPHMIMVILKLYMWKAHPAIRLMNAVFGRSASHVWFMAAWSWTVLIGLIVSFSSRSYLSSIQPVNGNQKICFHGQVKIGSQQNDYETRFK